MNKGQFTVSVKRGIRFKKKQIVRKDFLN